MSQAAFGTNIIIVFVGGPEDGRVVTGEQAWSYTRVFGQVQPNGEVPTTEAEVGSAILVTSSRLFEAGFVLKGEAFQYFKNCGVSIES